MSDRRLFRRAMPFLAGMLVQLMLVLPAHSLSMKECSVKFKAAQNAGQAEGVSWSEFRKTQCTVGQADASAVSEPTDAKPKSAEAKPGKTPKKSDAATSPASGETTFPSSVAARFAAEKPAKARMHTCLEQYRANKQAGTLGNLRWIAKGGGYYKLCNAKLKGDS
ncbi:hypothetical protein [Phyllobacterium lublinensis]|uniref:hypothetical protein n=1 Tax=Phyllobacterium lublinensis TaxID=2875708 RepID=UPI001CCE2DB8|nr:hypothetical protein [Phyllobacterium sp. 2063]MBZ9655013.1 hypothetical protein [Phyllobacterium sp. 2063]